MKTILFVSYNELHITWGGIHRVNHLLINGLAKRGYKCLYLINKDGQYFYIDNKEIPRNRIDRDGLKKYLAENNVNIIIDQEVIFTDSFTSVFDSIHPSDIKLVSVFHNSPSIYERLYGYKWLLSKIIEQEGISGKMPYIARLCGYPLWRKVSIKNTAKRYQSVYDKSNCCIMLSSSDIPTLGKYVPHLSREKCIAIPNALTFDKTSDASIFETKEKQVLVVSRLNDDEKRISLVLKIWRILQDKGITDWDLTIVGTGPHENRLKELAQKLKLCNVHFEGRQFSEPYYEKAAIFMMTSAVEGWGLTLTESMQRGVVPVAFDSYQALKDIITDKYDGFIISNNDLYAYADKIEFLMKNKKERERIAYNALKSCQRFSADKVIEKWVKLIEDL